MKKLTAAGVAMLLAGSLPGNATTFDIIVTYVSGGTLIDNDGNGAAPAEEFSDRQKQLFGLAEMFWESVLVGYSGLAAPTYNLVASLRPEDGIDGSLAFAGPTDFEDVAGTVNPANGNPFDRATGGYMQFDADDFGAGAVGVQTEKLFLDSAVHEIAHALGFGTQFSFNGLVSGDTYTGAGAVSTYNIVNGTSISSILLEAGGGHWDECWIEILTNSGCMPEDGGPDSGLFNDLELMTPFAVAAATFSPVTIAAFQDLGYETINPFSNVILPDVPADVSVVPLPAGALLLLSGLGGLAVLRRKRRS